MNEAFNNYVAGAGASNEGIIERLANNGTILAAAKRELLKSIPPKRLSRLHRDFLRVLLFDKQANDLYIDAVKAEDKDAAELLARLSTKYSRQADELLTNSLQELSIKTGRELRWRVQ